MIVRPDMNWRITAKALNGARSEEVHGSQDEFPGLIHRLGPPFKNGSLDEAAFRSLVSWQIAEGTHGLVPVGTTGESPTVSHDEHKRVVEWCVDEARGRVPVIAGAGSNSTREAIELAQHAEKAGASAALVVTPYYNKPTQEGMYQHFKAINDAIGIPIVIYNIPPRSVIDMSVDTMARLFELKNIAGVKDATASMVRVRSSARSSARISTSCRVRMRRCLVIWRMAVTAASRLPPTSRRGYALNFTWPGRRAT